MRKLLFLLFATQAFSATAATLKLEYGTIAPFNAEEMTIAEFIKEYAEIKDVMVTTPNTRKLQEKVNISTYSPITIDRLDDYFSQILGAVKMYALKSEGLIEVLPVRTAKYQRHDYYKSKDFPTKREYITVIHELKHPMAKSIQRSLRGQLSREGRIYSLAGKILLISDYGNKMKSMLDIVNEMDTPDAYQAYKKAMEEKARKEQEQGEKRPSNKKSKESIKTTKKEAIHA